MVEIKQQTINTPYMVGPVHCYTAELGGELVLFDTGPATEEGRKYLEDNVDLDRLRHIFITHCHIDHYGQSRWLEERTGATIYLSAKDALKNVQHHSRVSGITRIFASLGFDDTYLGELQKMFEKGEIMPPFPEKFKIAENDIPKHLGIEAIPCPGHSQSDVVYSVGGYAVTGDTLLRGIFQSPLLDADLVTGERFRNYEVYCESIVKLAALSNHTILPGHRKKVDGVKETLCFYLSKMLARVKQIHPFLGEANVKLLMDRLLKGRATNVFHIFLKASEIVFMIDLLKEPDRMRDSLERSGLWPEIQDLYEGAIL